MAAQAVWKGIWHEAWNGSNVKGAPLNAFSNVHHNILYRAWQGCSPFNCQVAFHLFHHLLLPWQERLGRIIRKKRI
eukprot:5662725-Amphidinium_carterae.1